MAGSPRRACPELAREAVRRAIARFMSASTVRRRPAQDALKPWQRRTGSVNNPRRIDYADH
ncbi:hypothetical protein ACWGCC_02225 [Streptomyces nigrescens]